MFNSDVMIVTNDAIQAMHKDFPISCNISYGFKFRDYRDSDQESINAMVEMLAEDVAECVDEEHFQTVFHQSLVNAVVAAYDPIDYGRLNCASLDTTESFGDNIPMLEFGIHTKEALDACDMILSFIYNSIDINCIVICTYPKTVISQCVCSSVGGGTLTKFRTFLCRALQKLTGNTKKFGMDLAINTNAASIIACLTPEGSSVTLTIYGKSLRISPKFKIPNEEEMNIGCSNTRCSK